MPYNWEIQGYGTAIYTNQTYPFVPVDDPPFVPDNDNTTGCYKRDFEIPSNWKDMQITIYFGGVSSAFYLWINGQKMGYSQDSRLSAEFDITLYLKKGNNTVSERVFRWSDGSYLEDQDHWRLSGIHRDAFLMASPKVELYDFFVQTDLDESYENADLLVDVKICIDTKVSTEGWKVEGRLYDAGGASVLTHTRV